MKISYNRLKTQLITNSLGRRRLTAEIAEGAEL